MSETSSSSSGPSSPSNRNNGSQLRYLRWVRPILYLVLAATLVAIACAGYKSILARSELNDSQEILSSRFGVQAPRAKHLAPEYTDQNGDLLADRPTVPSKLLEPDTLVVGYGEDPDLDVQPVNWENFKQHLARITGKAVETRVYNNSPGDVLAFKEGKIHVVALHAADAPYIVNNAGFIPIAVLGGAEGAIGNHLDLIVPSQSQIKSLADLKRHTLTTTSTASITGHRAAVAVLLQSAGLRPDIDYLISYSFSQTRSIVGIANGDLEAAAVSDDKLKTLLKDGRAKPSDYQIIYESQVIPRFTIGYAYNLHPELAAKVTQGIVEFKNEDATSDENEPPMHFVPINYQRDFEFVRKIDESFEPRLGPKPAKLKATSSSDVGQTSS
jgi:phosphonate transport system substrate-binding protein